MESRNRKLWVVLAAVAASAIIMAPAAPAQAVSFTFAHDSLGCLDDTVTFTPVLGSTPDSIRWVWGDASTDVDIAPPFDTTHIYTTTGDFDVEMHAWFAAVDSADTQTITVAGGPVAVIDGYSVGENDTLTAGILDNDSLFGLILDSAFLVTMPTFGTASIDTLNRLVYIPDLNFHGSDTLAYAIANICGGFDTATVAITTLSDFTVDVDSVGYVWVDHCTNSCDTVTGGTISLGDSIMFFVRVNPVDVQEIAAMWPRVFLPGLGGDATGAGDLMYGDSLGGTAGGLGLGISGSDSTWFWFAGTMDTAVAISERWHVITGGGIDAHAGFLEIYVEIRSDAGNVSLDTITIVEPVDTKMPDAMGADSVSFELIYDALGDGKVSVGDTVRFYIDLRNNPISGDAVPEICDVTVILWNWYDSAGVGVTIAMTDSAIDNRWFGVHVVPAGGGLLEADGGTQEVRFVVSDNACNLDSVSATLAAAVDIRGPVAGTWSIIFDRLADVDMNNCLGLGPDDASADSVIIRVTGVDLGTDTVYADLLSAGIAGKGNSTVTNQQYVHLPLTNLGGGVWELKWQLIWQNHWYEPDKDSVLRIETWTHLPYENPRTDTIRPIDMAGTFVLLTGIDAAKNWDTISTPALAFLVDTDVPEPVTIDSCVRIPVSADLEIIEIYWSEQALDAAWFQIYWNDDQGSPVDYTDTLAGVFDTSAHMWRSDPTVHPISPCREYTFNVWTVDDCGNLEREHPTEIVCRGDSIGVVTNLTCTPVGCGQIQLSWTSTASADSFQIWWDMGFLDDTDSLAATVMYPATSWLSGPDLGILQPGEYTWRVEAFDSCGKAANGVAPEVACEVGYPAPVDSLTCESLGGGVIELRWVRSGTTTPADYYEIWMGKDGVFDTIAVDQVDYTGTRVYTWRTDDAGLSLIEHGWYDFTVRTVDTCGFMDTLSDTVQCLSDLAPARACIFQPEPGALYCSPEGVTVYVCPVDATDDDVVSVKLLARYEDNGFGGPGPWFDASLWVSQQDQETCFRVAIDAATLNSKTGPGTTRLYEMIVLTTDIAGKVDTASAEAACDPMFWFDWSTEVLDGSIVSIDGLADRSYQSFCDVHGFNITQPVSDVVIVVEGGTAPYKIEAWIDGLDYWYMENQSANVTFPLDMEGFDKGLHILTVTWTDWCGFQGFAAENLCVADTIAPCAAITNPVDGKCIRRSRSMLDPVDICVTIDPLSNCIDPDNVLKIDYQWGLQCCDGIAGEEWQYFVTEDSSGAGDSGSCDTIFFPPPFQDLPMEIICGEVSGDTTVFVLDSVLVPCDYDSLFTTFAIEHAPTGGSVYCTEWWNTDDLEDMVSGDLIFIRAVVWDDQGNSFTTKCVQVCIDVDTPPLCIWSPDLCYDDAGNAKIGGTISIFADLDLAQGNIDDIDDVTLWYKMSSDPDMPASWTSLNSGFFGAGGNSTVWRWDDVNTAIFTNNVDYDFRVIATTIWGTVSHDLDGDLMFDAGTFDNTQCDMTTWFVDNLGPEIAIDTVWTDIDGQEVVQPNVSCTLSDPRGWAWMQWGQTITVQPWIFPGADAGDVTKVKWTLYDGAGGCSCSCDGGGTGTPSHSQFDDGSEKGGGACDFKVLRLIEGTGMLDAVTLDLTDAPFVSVQNGAQNHVLKVQAWDDCGNKTEDCITIWILDIDPTEAIVIEPMNAAVFCQDDENEGGGIEVTAAMLLDERLTKVVYYYRAQGGTWAAFDSLSWTGTGTNSNRSVNWYPHAMGLADGTYELTVVGVDHAGNRSDLGVYVTTVYLDCGVPTVVLTHPTADDPAFLGCEIDLRATATGSAFNPVDSVVFFYQSVTSGSASTIGTDRYAPDGQTYGYRWDPPALDGPYYIFARAWNKAKVMTESAMVWVNFDGTAPWVRIIEVNGDVNVGDDQNPTVITAGDQVPITVLARDDQSPNGYGASDNCGVDSVIVYVTAGSDTIGTDVFGDLALPVADVDTMYAVTWNTSGLANGTYTVWALVYDCGCNEAAWTQWTVKIVNPMPGGTLAIDEAIPSCGMPTVDGVQSLDINLTPAANADVSTVSIWRAPPASSDVYDQWSNLGSLTNVIDGVYHPVVDFDPSSWAEGLWRIRAVITSSTGAVSEDYNGDGRFDDFTFDSSQSHMMWLRVDRSVAPYTVSNEGVIQMGTDVTVEVTPADCDFDVYCYGVVAENGNAGVATCLSSPTHSFDPVDSGLVSVNNGVWHGAVRTTVSDAVGNSAATDTDLWILNMDSTQVMVTQPMWGAYVTANSMVVQARKLTDVSAFSTVEFYWGMPGGTENLIEGDVTLSGDVYSVTWDLDSVPDGMTMIWAVADGDADAGSLARHITVAKAPVNIVFMTPNPSYTRTVWDVEYTFVGARVDLCIWRDSISSIVSVGIDSVVFCYRFGDAPGNLVPENPDPDLGWVRIDADRYGSLCVDWFTDTTDLEEPGCLDGRYSVAAWVYDKAGNVNHNEVPMHVMVDNTAPYSEIHDIDSDLDDDRSDETFGDCTLVNNTNRVKFSGIAIDDRSCAGSDESKNSGAKFLQFFVGDCSEGGLSGCVDIVWVIDGSGSMGDDQVAIANNASLFFQALAGVDFRVGVAAYTDITNPVGTNSVFQTGGPGVGQFTTDLGTFASMVTAVGDTGSGTENGLTALTNVLDWYPFRADCNKVLVLVTDEDADDASEYDSLSALIFGANPIIHTVLDFGDSTGYSALAPTTNGEQFDITGSWGANLAAIASQIRALVAGDGNSMGVVWSETVEVTDGETDISAYWDPSGLPVGTYCAWTVSIDQIGNSFTSPQIEVCVTDVDPPVGYVSGFGTSTDEHMVNTRWVYGRTWNTDVASAQVQRRPVGSTDDRAWTTMGIGLMVNDDSTCWMAAWNWCLTTDGDYDLRWLMTDKAGNETDPADAQRATVNVNGCDVTVIAPSVSVAKVAFEDKTFENLGLVHVNDAATGMHHSMIGVFADMTGGLQVEKIKLWTDQSNSTHLMGTFDDSAILGGGTGKLWVAYNDFDAGITYLGYSMITVYHVEADLGFPGCVSDEVTGAKVCINPGALATNNGVVLLPARLPILALTQQHFQVWPDSSGNVLAARLTSPVSSFMIGKYAEVTIPYVSSLPTEMLTVAWWDGDEWNTTDGMIAGGEIGGGMATVYTTNLHGLYAVVSAGRECNSGALTVKHLDAVKSYNNWVGPMPLIRTVVRSNIEGGNGNGDISESDITVILDQGTDDELVLWVNNEQPDNGYYTSSWDNVTGIVSTRWNSGAPPLSEGDHTLHVLAFNKSGWCQSDTWSFQVDATEPDVDVTTSEVDTDPVFTITITDIGATTDLPGSGVDWDAVYVDVYDVTESEYNVIPKERLIHTETPDAYDTHDLNEATGEFTFTLIDRILSGRRLQIVIYDGDRDLLFNGDCGCEYYVYNHDLDGVPDMVGNHTEVVEEDFTVVDCAGPDCEGQGEVGISGPNPFNPFEGGAIEFDLNGFTGRVTVYDLAGERVAMIHNTVIDRQVASVMWDGRTDGDFGNYVAEGVYLVHFQSDGSSANTPTSQVLKVVVQRPN